MAIATRTTSSSRMPRQPAAAQGGRFEFGVVGDIPYSRAQEAEYARVMNDMNARDLAFVTHIGDCMFDPCARRGRAQDTGADALRPLPGRADRADAGVFAPGAVRARRATSRSSSTALGRANCGITC